MFSQGLQHFTAEAVVPEQLLHYVTAVAGSRPLACAGFPAYLLEGHLVLVAYDAAMLETFSGGPDLEAAAARVKEATAVPVWVCRSSGSRVKRPIIVIWLSISILQSVFGIADTIAIPVFS